ncbi:MAG: methionine ABC transporter ATP-binding protein [Actinomycetaceae bacterium]|nr:methionine ABC transporter ATP-binding protein [Actinomycetaceae bacterium]
MIELRDVRKEYLGKAAAGGKVVALDGISMQVAKGSIHGIVGQSGAGKSTLIRCLTALEKPTSGTITVDGQDLTALGSKDLRLARRKIGMVFQTANLLDSRTAAGNIAYPLYLAGVPKGARHDRVQELLTLVGLGDRGSSYPSQLSGGQRQRIGIARALADEPAVILCDEPTSALDTETTGQVLHLLRDVRDRLGVTIIIITHEMSVVREVCDSVTLLENGRIVETGRVEDILMNPHSVLSRELIPPPVVDVAPVLDGRTTVLIDVAFTSSPGKPTGSEVMGLAASVGADIAGGTFETVGSTQVGRLVLAVPTDLVNHVNQTLLSKGLITEVRS